MTVELAGLVGPSGTRLCPLIGNKGTAACEQKGQGEDGAHIHRYVIYNAYANRCVATP